jgi:hypothetical protein
MPHELLDTLRRTIDAGRRLLTPPGSQTAAPTAEPSTAGEAPPPERPQGPAQPPGGREKRGG